MNDAARLQPLLDAFEPGLRLLDAKPLTGGVSAEVSRLLLSRPDGEPLSIVLREHGERHAGLDAQLEYDLLCAVHGAGIPTAEPLLVDATGEHLGVPCLLLAFVDGTSSVAPEALPAALNKMAQRLAAIHQLPLDGFPSLPLRLDPLPEVLEYLPQGERWQGLAPLLESLDDTSCQGEPRLLHGDFWPENLLWREEELVAILDWEDGAFGDPLCDLAGARIELRYRYGLEAMHAFTRAYAAGAPIDERRLALWQIYVATAGQHFMGKWGLPAKQEAHMRREALLCIEEAAAVLGRG